MSLLRQELGKRRPFDSPEQEAFLSILRTASVLEEPFGRLFKASGLSMATYNVLRIVRGELQQPNTAAGVSCQVIGERLVARGPDVTRLVDRLERLALVRRIRGTDDRRVVLVAITRKGLDLLAELDEPVRELHSAQLQHLSKPDLCQLIALLERARKQTE